jgi:hypothetical protein
MAVWQAPHAAASRRRRARPAAVLGGRHFTGQPPHLEDLRLGRLGQVFLRMIGEPLRRRAHPFEVGADDGVADGRALGEVLAHPRTDPVGGAWVWACGWG